jgi:chromate reductase, NAD(P)H dehydrogenase (quinone)
VAVLGATAGPWGTRLAQASLRQVLHTCGALVMPAPTVFIAHAADRFDADGSLADQGTVRSLQCFVLAFERWMTRLSPTIAQAPATLAVAH